MEGFFKGTGKLTKKQLERNLQAVQTKLFPPPDVGLAWHVRAWGWWVLQRAKAELRHFYPVVGGQPTVAYLWARTVRCKNCRATVPLLKTRWLCKKDNKRVLLMMEPKADGTGVSFGVQTDVPVVGSNAAQRREHDKRIGVGTMSRSGATCPCCKAIMTMEDIRFEGQASRLGTMMTAVVVDGKDGKEYRLPTTDEIRLTAETEKELQSVFTDIPFGLPEELINTGSIRKGGVSITRYGIRSWNELFTPRQLLALGTFVKYIQAAYSAMKNQGYSLEWVEGVCMHLVCIFDRMLDFNSLAVSWITSVEAIGHTFVRYALPITWDYSESAICNFVRGSWEMSMDAVLKSIDTISIASAVRPPAPLVGRQSAQTLEFQGIFDVIITDPPYYDAIPYADLMDFFYVWLRRMLYGLSSEIDKVFEEPLVCRWDSEKNDGELIDDESRFGGDTAKSKTVYEEGMFHSFQACRKSLKPEGRLVIVFANKQPDAWETLVSAIIRAGFVVDGSWPIQTEQAARMRAQSSAALSSSVWLICKRRSETARPGWDNRVLEEMHENITLYLRDFWDAGIRGPDFVWAATGPALEAYSKHPVVRKANEPGQLMTVSEFLRHVRRIVVDFVVGRVLSGNGDAEAVSGLDDVTTYYLLHRHDFKMEDAPAGACILYAVSCGLSDSALADQYDILVRTGGHSEAEEDDEDVSSEDTDIEPEEGTGSRVKLRSWHQRTRKSLGYEAPGGRPAPLIDQIHRLMHLWKAGDVIKVDEYLEAKALRRNALFHQLLQALIELAPVGSEERSLLESISNHVVVRGVAAEQTQRRLPGI
jgi:adenine-specific DNA methylase